MLVEDEPRVDRDRRVIREQCPERAELRRPLEVTERLMEFEQ